MKNIPSQKFKYLHSYVGTCWLVWCSRVHNCLCTLHNHGFTHNIERSWQFFDFFHSQELPLLGESQYTPPLKRSCSSSPSLLLMHVLWEELQLGGLARHQLWPGPHRALFLATTCSLAGTWSGQVTLPCPVWLGLLILVPRFLIVYYIWILGWYFTKGVASILCSLLTTIYSSLKLLCLAIVTRPVW